MIAEQPVFAKMKVLLILEETSSKIEISHKTKVSLRCSMTCCLWKHLFDSHWSETPSDLTSLTFFVILRPLTLF